MKQILPALIVMLLVCSLCLNSYAQTSGVSINSSASNPDPSSMLDVSSTTKGVLIPRLTIAQRDAISNPAEGLTIYNLDTKCYDYYNGTKWFTLCGVEACSTAPATPGAISGATTQNPNSSGLVYSISPVSGANTYTWTVPSGWTITAGAGTTSITVTSGTAGQNGNITVTSGNLCGNSAAQALAVAAGYVPTSFSDLWIWYDANDASTFSLSGSSVLQWNDKSGNAHHCSQSNSTNSPTLVTNQLNGKSVVRFNGSNTYLATSPLQFFTSNNAPKTVLLVFKASNTSSQKFLLVQPFTSPSCSNETEIGFSTGDQTIGNFGPHGGCGNATVAPGGTIVTSAWNIMTVLFKSSGSSPNQLSIYKNGGAPISIVTNGGGYWAAGSYPTQTNVLYVGARININDCYFPGDLAEVIMYNRQLSSTELNQLHSYISSKYGLAVSTIP